MTKNELYKCYTSYLNKYLEIQQIKNISFLENAQISKFYLEENKIEHWNRLPNELSATQVMNLNTQHSDRLKWKLLESSLTPEEINDFEKKHQMKLPQSFRDFLLGYTPLFDTVMTQVVASEDYDCYSYDPKNDTFEYVFADSDYDTPKTATVLISLVPIFYGHELSYWEEWEPFYQMFFPFGLIYLGDYCGAVEERL